MGRYKFEDVEWDDDDQILAGGKRRFAREEVDYPTRSPIRRKDKLRQEIGFKAKAKRNHKKIQNKI
jgi:hypothetical protein